MMLYARLNGNMMDFSDSSIMIPSMTTGISAFMFTMGFGCIPRPGVVYTIQATLMSQLEGSNMATTATAECVAGLCLQVEAFRAAAHQNISTAAMQHPDVLAAVRQAQAAGVPWAQIIGVLINFAISVLSGAPIDFAGLIAQILALIGVAQKKP